MGPRFHSAFFACALLGIGTVSIDVGAAGHFHVLAPSAFEHHVERFNRTQPVTVTNHVSDAGAWAWLSSNIPLFACSDPEVEEVYYFRWWSFRKHLKATPDGFVFTEFLVPIRHAGLHNTLSCALGHHLVEGRWLRDQRYLDQYIHFWLRGRAGKPQPHLHQFSGWLAAAVLERDRVHPNPAFVTNLLDELVADYRLWEEERMLPEGLFWQHDVKDGMEESISGSRALRQARPTINSYMFGNARAIGAIAQQAGRQDLARQFESKADELRRRTMSLLWDPAAQFFKVRQSDGRLAPVREQMGFIPWYFNLPESGHEQAWAQLMDPDGFRAPFGMTTAERRHPAFRSHGCCGCEWDGAVWPFATSQTLVALGNLLRDYDQSVVSKRDYFDCFLSYVRCHRFDGQPYIGEYLDETTGQWLKGRQARSRFYNHSTFADLLITGVVGLRPRSDDQVEIHPLLPPGTWDWFCLDGLRYHGRTLTVLWDAHQKFGRGAGFRLWVDGVLAAESDKLERLTWRLP